jgi:D-aminopeptidase
MPNDITTGAQTVTAAGAVTGTLSTAALTSLPTIKLDIAGLTAGATARIAIEDTASSTAFSDAQAAAIFDVEGQIVAGDDVELSVTADLIPSLRYGAANNALRANVLRLTGSSPSLTLHAYTD